MEAMQELWFSNRIPALTPRAQNRWARAELLEKMQPQLSLEANAFKQPIHLEKLHT